MTQVDPGPLSTRPARHWDHWNDPAVCDDVWGWFRAHNDADRAFWSEDHGGFWVLTRYEDIYEAFRNNELFSTNTLIVPRLPYDRKWIPGQIDPPAHTSYRRMLLPLFAPDKVEGIEDQVRASAARLIDAFAGSGRCEFFHDFARPYPAVMFARQMGLPEDDVVRFKDWADDMMSDQHERARAADYEVAAYLAGLIQERKRRTAGGDWMDIIVQGTYDGRPFSDDEMLNMAQFMFLAGLITVTSLLGVCFFHLAQRPDLRAELRDPALLPTAVEEMLRFCGNTSPCRELKQDTEFAGVQMRRGDIVFLSTPAANHDHREFPNPERIDFHRSPNRHLTFGVGVHRCLGLRLAKLEIAVALEEWHRLVPDYGITPGTELRWHGGVNAQLKHLPLTWEV